MLTICVYCFVFRFGVPFQNLDLKKHVRSGGSSEDLAKQWFATLSKAQIRALYDVYQVAFQNSNLLSCKGNEDAGYFQVDFVLYGYTDVQDYIDLGTGE